MPKTSDPNIEALIYLIRGQKVMMDYDLAALYGIETKTLNQAVKRNVERFPSDFMFQLNEIERENLMRSQSVTASRHKVNLRYFPYAFTELGIAMLSGVLNSAQAIQVHISIIRVFFRLREVIHSAADFSGKLELIEKNADRLFRIVFERLDDLEKNQIPIPPRKRIGI
jgi:hypothetical protein